MKNSILFCLALLCCNLFFAQQDLLISDQCGAPQRTYPFIGNFNGKPSYEVILDIGECEDFMMQSECESGLIGLASAYRIQWSSVFNRWEWLAIEGSCSWSLSNCTANGNTDNLLGTCTEDTPLPPAFGWEATSGNCRIRIFSGYYCNIQDQSISTSDCFNSKNITFSSLPNISYVLRNSSNDIVSNVQTSYGPDVTLNTGNINGSDVFTVYAYNELDSANCNFAFTQQIVVNNFVPYFQGSGTENDPYLISNLTELRTLSENTCLWDKYFKQSANIDANLTSTWNSGQGFSPIGEGINHFKGAYDGDNFEIQNLFINRPGTTFVGLFGRTSTVFRKIRNVKLVNANITGGTFTGGLTGYAEKVHENCNVTGQVTGQVYTGGLVGSNSSAEIVNCHTDVTVIGTNYVGGLIGFSSYSISECSSIGNVTGNENVAGITGYMSGSITKCFSSGNIIGNNYVGGLTSYNTSYNVTSNCYSTANVTGIDYVGGLIGNNYSNVNNCYSKGTVNSSGSIFGGLIGFKDEGTITNSFWDTQTSGLLTSDGGIGKITSDMQNITTYTNDNWNFNTIWKGLSCSNGYPILANQNENVKPTISTTSPFSRCNSGTLNLQANASAGVVDWYQSQNGNMLQHTGTSFTTPILSANKNYWVEANDNGCKSATRTLVRATIENCTSEISENFCSTTISAFDERLTVIKIKDASDYQYEAFDGVSTLTYERGNSGSSFKMSNFPSIKHQTTYQVRVRAYVYGAWQDWSAYCNITTPKSKVKDNFCGQTITSLNTFLSIYPVANATNYEYEAFDGTNTLTFQKGSGDLTFRMSLFPAVQNNKSYEVRVRPYVNNVWGDWSDYCTINTPSLREGYFNEFENNVTSSKF
jgi:hypothetical protein